MDNAVVVSSVRKVSKAGKEFYTVFAMLSDGTVGQLYSPVPYKQGDKIQLSISVDFNGKFQVRLVRE